MYGFSFHYTLCARMAFAVQILALLAACVVGVGISYAGFNLRKLVTATSFTVSQQRPFLPLVLFLFFFFLSRDLFPVLNFLLRHVSLFNFPISSHLFRHVFARSLGCCVR